MSIGLWLHSSYVDDSCSRLCASTARCASMETVRADADRSYDELFGPILIRNNPSLSSCSLQWQQQQQQQLVCVKTLSVNQKQKTYINIDLHIPVPWDQNRIHSMFCTVYTMMYEWAPFILWCADEHRLYYDVQMGLSVVLNSNVEYKGGREGGGERSRKLYKWR